MFKFRLFVAAGTQNSAQAVANLDALCQEFLPGQYEVELIDVLSVPKRALEERIFMTPTLLRLEPAPVLRLVGTLGDAAAVCAVLGLGAVAA